jgi:putative transposase
MAKWVVKYRSMSIALACRTLEISESCYRYQPKLSDKNEKIAAWLLAPPKAKRACGFGLTTMIGPTWVLEVLRQNKSD